MSDLEELFSKLPIADIAKQVGASEGDTRDAVSAALPALFKGLQANASDPAGAESLLGALQTKDHGLVSGNIDLGDIDLDDGAAIVGNIFGDKKDNVAAQLGTVGGDGVGKSLMQKILPILAPIVLAFIAKKLFGGNSGSSNQASSGGLNDILGNVLGGALGGSSSGGSSGGGLNDILGNVLGGALGGSSSGGSSGGGDILGDLLGGLLGGGKR